MNKDHDCVLAQFCQEGRENLCSSRPLQQAPGRGRLLSWLKQTCHQCRRIDTGKWHIQDVQYEQLSKA